LKAIFVSILLALSWTLAHADDAGSTVLAQELEAAAGCVAAAKPEFAQTQVCYVALLERTIFSCTDGTGTSSFESCLITSIDAIKSLLPEYVTHTQADDVAMYYDLEKCDPFRDQETELLLQCQHTAYWGQLSLGHVASIWGGLPHQN